MEKTINFCDVIGASSGEHSNMLGKFCTSPSPMSWWTKRNWRRCARASAWTAPASSACPWPTPSKAPPGDIRDRITVRRDGEQKFYQIYCRENKSTPNVLSRELVKETVNQRTNQYEKLANIHYDKADQRFGYDDLAYDEDVDAMKYCHSGGASF